MDLNVLVTGGAGYLGSVVSSYLLLKGHKVRVLDSLLHGGQSLLGLYPNRNFEFIRGSCAWNTKPCPSLDPRIECKNSW